MLMLPIQYGNRIDPAAILLFISLNARQGRISSW